MFEGPRMEDQRVQSPQTMKIGCTLSSRFWISIADLKQLKSGFWIQLLERLVTPRPIKWLQKSEKSSAKTQTFALAWRINLNMWLHAAKLVFGISCLFLHHVLNSYMITLKSLPTEVNWPQKTFNPLKTKFPGSNWSVLVMQIEQSEFINSSWWKSRDTTLEVIYRRPEYQYVSSALLHQNLKFERVYMMCSV